MFVAGPAIKKAMAAPGLAPLAIKTATNGVAPDAHTYVGIPSSCEDDHVGTKGQACEPLALQEGTGQRRNGQSEHEPGASVIDDVDKAKPKASSEARAQARGLVGGNSRRRFHGCFRRSPKSHLADHIADDDGDQARGDHAHHRQLRPEQRQRNQDSVDAELRRGDEESHGRCRPGTP